MTKKSRPKREWRLRPDQYAGIQRLSSSSAKCVIGIDEVGRGSWAGPLVVAGVCMPKEWRHPEVKDSKKMTHKSRMKALHEHIYPNALAYVVLSMTNEQIDKVGLGKAQYQLTEGCGLYLRHRYPEAPVVQDGTEKVPILDGQELNNGYNNLIAFKDADEHVPCVSAASVLAKVTRDLYMKEENKKFPGYGFDTNVGYHSKKHRDALDRWGITPLHRKSFGPVALYC